MKKIDMGERKMISQLSRVSLCLLSVCILVPASCTKETLPADSAEDGAGDMDSRHDGQEEEEEYAVEEVDDFEAEAQPGPICGNGAVETGEECDDGNTEDGDGCDSDCAFSCRGEPAPAMAVSAGESYTCAVSAGGGALCWGNNASGRLGDGTTTGRTVPVDVYGLTWGVSAVEAGMNHTCAVLDTGAVKCWGLNVYGQLGCGIITNYEATPVDVAGLSSEAAAVAVGYGHTCVLTRAGGVKCWGLNGEGELGDGTTIDRVVPVDVHGLDSGAAAITAGLYYTCALLDTGGVKCWGYNYEGQLGDGTTAGKMTPVDVAGLASGVSAVSAAYNQTCALVEGGEVKCWGANESGQLGDGTTTNRSTPVPVVGLTSGVSGVSAGGDHTCALTSAGGVKCWGWNSSGELGDGTQTTKRLTPVDVSGLESGVSAISAGLTHTCALLITGEITCWGGNDSGQFGDGTTTRKTAPVTVEGLPLAAAAITAGQGHTCAVLISGEAKCWGRNLFGQLGNGAETNSAGPVGVISLDSGVSAMSAGCWHTCALVGSGEPKCWGGNAGGQIGDGTMTDRAIPTAVSGLATGLLAISAGFDHSCAVLPSGGVKCWGKNVHGQVGDGTTEWRYTPSDVLGLDSGALAVSAGTMHSCALLEGGGVKCWGRNLSGQLGDGTMASSSIPVDVSGLSLAITAVSAGGIHTCALTSAGGVTCWGGNELGQLGDGTTVNSPVPVSQSGKIIHYNGVKWTLQSGGTGNDLNAIWGSGPDDVFAVGDWGTVIHYNGKQWTVISSGQPPEPQLCSTY